MWPRWRTNFNEEWLRKKEYLVRSLFDECQVLSPIPEAEESGSSYETSSTTYEVWNRTDDLELRPWSPLPPLIIERIPNYHDEPEEFYTQLEVKMKKLYQRMFVEGDSESLNSDDDSQKISNNNSFETHIPETSQITHSTLSTNENSTNENQIETKDVVNTQESDTFTQYIVEINQDRSNSSSNSPNVNSETSKSDDIGYKIITIEADVHRDADNNETFDESVNQASVTFTTSNAADADEQIGTDSVAENGREADTCKEISEAVNTSLADGYEEQMDSVPDNSLEADEADTGEEISEHISNEDNDYEEQMSTDSEHNTGVEENIDSPNNSSTNSKSISNDEIEIMREANFMSAHSMLNPNYSTSHLSDKDLNDEIRPEMSDLAEDLSNEIYANDFNIALQTSTPNNRKRRRTFGVRSSLRRLCSPLTTVEHHNVSVQVEERDSNFLNHNFFVGQPKIFKLCSCLNHVCESH